MKPNKQKTDWKIEFYTILNKHADKKDFYWTKLGTDLEELVDNILLTQRQQLIKEIEGIVGEDEISDDGTIELAEEIVIINDNNITKEDVLKLFEEEIKTRNQLRKEIRERIKQITNLKEK